MGLLSLYIRLKNLMSLNVLVLDIFVDFEHVCFFSNQKILEIMRKFLVRNGS